MAILIASARGGQIKDEIDKLGDAARVFAVTEGGTAEYRLGLLTGQVKPVFGNNLNVFEREFPKLSIHQQTMLTLLILEKALGTDKLYKKPVDAGVFLGDRLPHEDGEAVGGGGCG